MKKTYDVLVEYSGRLSVKIEAESAEEAVSLVREQNSQKTLVVDTKPTWVEDADKAEELGEYSTEVQGYCDKCGYPLLRRYLRVDDTRDEHPLGWDWTNGTPTQSQVGPDLRPEYFTWCRGCLRSPLEQLADQSG